uniref:Phosphoglycolate phosphatase n=1 Tax=Ditylenchus dipsaci TaxID=166011 RepID=A0A915CWU1_9BILA
MPQLMRSDQFPSLLKDIDTFIFDADGVLWLGEDAIEGSPQFLEHLLKLGKRVIVLTNNATKSRAVYAKKLHKLGYSKQIGKENIVNPAAVAADTLHRAGITGSHKKVYLIGGQGVKDELKELGIEYFGTGPDPVDEQASAHNQAFLYDIELTEDAENVGAVVVGYEKYFNYLKLMKAANYLQDEQCLFVATNEDETCPGPNPVVGKPNTSSFDYICRRWKINPTRTMMIGDRTNTDVKFGRDHGLKTMLVLSGCHQIDDIVENQMNERHDMVPNYYAPNIGSLLPLLSGVLQQRE